MIDLDLNLDLFLYVSDLFVGQLRSALTCTVCSYVSNTFDIFLDLSLPIRKVRDSVHFPIVFLSISFYNYRVFSIVHCLLQYITMQYWCLVYLGGEGKMNASKLWRNLVEIESLIVDSMLLWHHDNQSICYVGFCNERMNAKTWRNRGQV